MNLASSLDYLELRVRSACAELGNRLRAGDECQAEEYLELLPQSIGQTDLLLEIVYTEYAVREELGQVVSQEDWLKRFPAWSNEIQQMFEVHQQICPLGRSWTQSSFSAQADQTIQGRQVPEAIAFERGRVIGGYQLLEEIGRGGMGVVFRAIQLSLNREVALKMILSGEFAGPRELARFQSEAEACARLHHPNIVQVFEVGAHNRCPFLSMELIQGGSLEDRLRNAVLEPREAAILLGTIARAVSFAHHNGVLHRDLKPSNVLLTFEGQPKVADFGLAKRFSGEAATVLQSSAMVGTPSHMAPETIELGASNTGPASDVYSLGVILYEMLTGRLPFVAQSPLELLKCIAREDPPSPSLLRRGIPKDLETICLKCLEKDPAQRYRSADDLAEDLLHFQQGLPILARPITRVERLLKWTKRKPLLATFILMLMFSLSAVSMLWWAASEREVEARQKALDAEQQRTLAEQERARSERSLYFRRVGQVQGERNINMIGRAQRLLEDCPPSMRDFEWHYLNSICNSELMILRGHRDTIWSLAVSPDESVIATGSGEWGFASPGEIILWNAHTGEILRRIEAHDGPIMGLGFSPDGRYLASCSIGWESAPAEPVKIWSVAGELMHTLPLPARNAYSVRFSPDGKWLAIGASKKVQMWETESFSGVSYLEGHQESVFEIAFSPNSQKLASVGRDGTARIFDIASGVQTQLFSGLRDLRCVSFSPDGRYLAFTSYGGDLRVWDTTDPPDKIQKYSYSFSAISSFEYSPEGRRMALAGKDGAALIIDSLTGRVLKRFYTHDGTVRGVAFADQGRKLVTIGIEGLVKVWDARVDYNEFTVDIRKFSKCGTFKSIRLSPDGKRALLPNGFNHGWHGVGEKSLLVFDLPNRRLLHTLKGHTGWLLDAAISRDGTRYASSSVDGTIRIWSSSGELLAVLEHPTGTKVHSIQFARDLNTIVSGASDGVVRIWDIQAKSIVREFRGHESAILCIAVDEEDGRIASGGVDKEIRVWEFASGSCLQQLVKHTDEVRSLEFDRSGKLLASAGKDTQVVLWNIDSGNVVHTLSGHSRPVNSVAFSPDGNRVASCGADWMVRLWDVESGEEALAIHLDGPAEGLAFHPTGKQLYCTHSWLVHCIDSQPTLSPNVEREFLDANTKWHSRQSYENRKKGLKEAADFHYEKLSRLPSTNAEESARRRRVLAQLGMWHEALAESSKGFESSPTVYSLPRDLTFIHLALRNKEEYLKNCQSYLDLLDHSSDPQLLNESVWLAALGACPRTDYEMLRTWMELAIERNKARFAWYQNTLALVYYREGNYEAAQEASRASMQANNSEFVEDWLLMAMTEAKLGRLDSAQKWFLRYESWLKDSSPSGGIEAMNASAWERRIAVDILSEEARRLLETIEADSSRAQ